MKQVAVSLLLFFATSVAQAQDTRTFFSPGFKFGYSWGEGMFAGLEFTYTVMPSAYGVTYGAAFNLDLLRSGAFKMHLGIQGGQVIGAQVGPTFLKEQGKVAAWGYSATVYGLIVVMPYYTYTDLFGRTMNETGVLIKIPIQLTGRELGSIFKT